MNVVVKRLDETNITYDQIVNLMHESFEERLQQGLNFTCSFMTVEQYKEKNTDGIIFVAVDDQNNNLLGTAVVHVKQDEDNVLYGYKEDVAVSPLAKRCGIGTMLEKEIEKLCEQTGCEYMICDTAVGALSSVKYHLKNGYKIIALRSYSSTNYFSYILRKQIKKYGKWNNSLYCKLRFIKSFFKERMCFKKDGSKTSFYQWYSKCKKK